MYENAKSSVFYVNLSMKDFEMLLQDRIKQIREHFGLSQAHFAQKINKSPGFISLVETGRSNVSNNTIKSICAAFSINESWLRNGEGQMTSQAAVDMENVGNRIREIRRGEGLTQEEFAAATGYTNVQIHLVESGKVKPSDKFLHKVSETFEVSQEWLVTGVGDRKAHRVDKVDERLISWLNEHPEIIRELRMRSGLD